MGPAANKVTSRSPLDPPIFSDDGDLQVWRKKVARWVDLISTAAEKGTEKAYKTVFATLGLQPTAQRFIVDEAEEKKVIDYKKDDQVKAVREIVELIAVDPPIAMVTSLITSFKKVSSGLCKENKDLPFFVSRFRRFVAEHLIHEGGSSSSETGEVLTIMLLNNADMEKGKLTNAKLQLIALAESRTKRSTPEAESLKVRVEILDKIVKASSDLAEVSRNPPQTLMRNTRGFKRALQDIHEKIVEISMQFVNAIAEINLEEDPSVEDNIARLVVFFSSRCILQLDDAVTVLRSLSFTSKNATYHITKHDVKTTVGQRVQKSLFSIDQGTDGPLHNFSSSKSRYKRKLSKVVFNSW